MPTALITGITGQDGSYLAERLIGEGWEVHALVRNAIFPEESEIDPAVVQHLGDLGDHDSLERAVREASPTTVFNLAGLSSVARSWEEPVLTAEVGGVAVAVLLEACRAHQESTGREVRFLQASSSEIFGRSDELPQNERTAIRPVSPYGAAKAFAHHLVGVYRNRGLFASTAILYNHESPRRPRSFVTRKITSTVAEIARNGGGVLSLGNTEALRDWGWAPDYVDAMMLIAAAAEPDDFIVATGRSHSVDEFVETAFRAVGIDDWHQHLRIDERFARPVDAPVMTGDASKLRRTLGWRPTLDFDAIVKAMVRHDLEVLDRASTLRT